MDEETERTIRHLRHSVSRLRAVLRSGLDGKNAYDEDFCRWCWRLDGTHHPGCWIDRAEKVMKETGL